MDKIQKQILANQLYIILEVGRVNNKNDKEIVETRKLLNPTKEKEPCCDMEETRQ